MTVAFPADPRNPPPTAGSAASTPPDTLLPTGPARHWNTLTWALLAMVALLPVGVLALLSYHFAAGSVRAFVHSNNMAAATVTAELLDHDLDDGLRLANAVAGLPGMARAVEAHDVDGVRECIKPIVSAFPSVDRGYVLDTKGILWADYPISPESLGQDFSFRDYYTSVVGSASSQANGRWRTSVSEVFKRRAEPSVLVVAFAIPMFDSSSRPIGILVHQSRLERITDWLDGIRVGAGGYVFVLDHNGAVAGHPKLPMQDRRYDDYARLAPVQSAIHNQQTVTEYFDPLSKATMVATFTPVEVEGRYWVVVAQQPVELAYAPIRGLQIRIAAGAGILMLLAISVAWLLGNNSRRLTEQNRDLNRSVGQLKNAEEEVRRVQRFLESIVENLPNMVFVKDARELRFVSFNRAAEELLGYRREQMVGKNDYDFFPKAEADFFTAKDRAVLEGGRLVDIPEEPIHTQSNETRILHTKKIPMMDGSNRPVYLLGISEDITERKRAEEALDEKTRELQRSNSDLEQFAYVASHDLQEPLRMIASYVQLLERRYRGKLDADADEFIGFAVDGAKRMQRLINDLLSYSRVGTKGSPFEPTDCERLVRRILIDLKPAIEESRAEVTHDPLPTVDGDPGQLAQVFQNLIANAIKFHGDQPPRVHIAAELHDGQWRFAVRDNGIGIPPEHRDRIFLIFQRLHNRGEYPGTGIGLAIVKRIVERHSGRIWVESEPGQGSTFFFTIPQDMSVSHDI